MKHFGSFILFLTVSFLVRESSCEFTDTCNYDVIEGCLGEANEMFLPVYARPFSYTYTLLRIKNNFCGQRLDTCLDNCTGIEFLSHQMVVAAIQFVCDTDISRHSACIGNKQVQEGLTKCYQGLHWGKMMQKDVCRAYLTVRKCSRAVISGRCTMSDQRFVDTLVDVTSQDMLNAFRCV